MVYENVNLAVWRNTRGYRGKRILDIGCGSGSLGELLVRNGNTVVGITHDPDEVAIARDRLSEVHKVDLEMAGGLAATVDLTSFDVVILAGVLEHLRDPVAVLRSLAPALDRGVPVYISLPNIACWYIRLGLLLGRFEPRDEGILDRTHLHHYTLSTATSMLNSAGLDVDHTDIVPSMSVFLYSFVLKPVLKPEERPKTERGDFLLYQRWIFPVERLVASVWKRGLANEITFVCRKSVTR